MQIFKEKAGVISEKPVWVCFHHEFMYTSRTIIGLIFQIITEWKNEKHMVG